MPSCRNTTLPRSRSAWVKRVTGRAGAATSATKPLLALEMVKTRSLASSSGAVNVDQVPDGALQSAEDLCAFALHTAVALPGLVNAHRTRRDGAFNVAVDLELAAVVRSVIPRMIMSSPMTSKPRLACAGLQRVGPNGTRFAAGYRPACKPCGREESRASSSTVSWRKSLPVSPGYFAQ